MDFRFFRYPSPEPGGPEPEWPQSPDFTMVALHRSADPDAGEHDGHDYLGGYGDAAAMEAWAAEQKVDVIGTDELPSPPAFYPPPFPETQQRVRARWPDGTFRPDDPTTPENEAWSTL